MPPLIMDSHRNKLLRICGTMYYSGSIPEHSRALSISVDREFFEIKKSRNKGYSLVNLLYSQGSEVGIISRISGVDYSHLFGGSGHVYCSCKDYEYRHRKRNNEHGNGDIHHCKHLKRLSFLFLERYHGWTRNSAI